MVHVTLQGMYQTNVSNVLGLCHHFIHRAAYVLSELALTSLTCYSVILGVFGVLWAMHKSMYSLQL